METKTYETSCDMGSIKIFTEDVSLFFVNEIGDMPNTVHISEAKPLIKQKRKLKYLGHFTVKTKAFLSSYDCADDPIHEFGPGRYWVELYKDSIFYIYKQDDALHS